MVVDNMTKFPCFTYSHPSIFFKCMAAPPVPETHSKQKCLYTFYYLVGFQIHTNIVTSTYFEKKLHEILTRKIEWWMFSVFTLFTCDNFCVEITRKLCI